MYACAVSVENDAEKVFPRILVGICSARKYRERRDTVRETWLTYPGGGVKTVFFVGRGEVPLVAEPDVVELEASDAYQDLPEKVLAFFSHALETSDFEWLFKCDDDSYVALDRLPELVDGKHEFIADELLRTRGAPSGGAGYLLSRRMIELLVQDESLRREGPEDVIIGQAALATGAASLSTWRLFREPWRFPLPHNDLVSTHWCSVERMRAIHALFREPTEAIRVIHHSWQDDVHLHPGGYFVRRSSFCSGHWERSPAGSIHLRWYDWPEEMVLPEPRDGTSAGKMVVYRCPKAPVETVTVRLAHGLGNQMFQYAHGLALARQLNAELKLVWEGGTREFGLSLFGLGLDVEPTEAKVVEDWDSYRERHEWPTLQAILKSGAPDVAVRGLFQNENYFTPVQEEVRRVFALQPSLPVDTAGRVPVCIHVRRGDYLYSSAHHLCDASYYFTGMTVIRGLVDNPLFLVVSDDPDWCAVTFKGIPDLIVLPGQSTELALRTMYACQAFVIPNSTFSWWGAWMSGAKLVVAPRRFLANHSWNVCPEGWILLPCEGVLEV